MKEEYQLCIIGATDVKRNQEVVQRMLKDLMNGWYIVCDTGINNGVFYILRKELNEKETNN